MTRKALMLGAALAVWGAASASAQQRTDSTRADTTALRLRELVVESRRPIATVGGSAALELEITALRLPAAPTLEQVFRTLPLLHVRRNSRGESEISARGSESRQVAVLVDGIPLTLSWDARMDASVIPANAVQRVGFIRGLSSMLYGPNVLGGVVELGVGQSFAQPERLSAQVSSGVDHVGGFGGTATILMPFTTESGRWLARAGAGFSDSPGQPLASGVAEPVPTDRDLRLNTDSRIADGFFSVRYQAERGAWFTLSGTTSHAERGVAAELGVLDADARLWRVPRANRSIVIASGGTGDRRTPFGGVGDLEASVGLDLGRTDIDSYTARDYSTTNGFENGKDRTVTIRLLGDHTLGQHGELRGSFTASEIRHEELLTADTALYRQQLWSAGGETVWRLIESGPGINSLRVSIGGAYDVGRTPETGGRPALGTLHSWGARAGFSMVVGDGNMLVHGGISRRARFPALRELYSGSLDRFAPNPGLEPENLVAMEGGITARLGDTEIQTVAFRHQMNDAVVRIVLSDGRFMRVNRDRLTSYGMEVLASTLVGRFTLGADFTLQSVSLTDPDAGITNRPENLPELFGSLYGRARLGWGLEAGAEARYTGSQYCLHPATGVDTRLSGGAVVNGELARQWQLRRAGGLFQRLETTLSAFNAGNAALYDQCGLPQPGRLVRFQVRVM
ncbi:MAG TPA: TonB-dependent receptor [Gemmatimonadales bacterium]|nr:TonB-dependent receptor [Gemmatimonadales bacterium]